MRVLRRHRRLGTRRVDLADAPAGFARPQHLCTTHLVPDGPAVYRVESEQADWERGHIPGAGHLDLQGELSARRSPFRFTIPPAADFAAAISRRGVGERAWAVGWGAT